jgi:uncharacterized membrane protein
MHLLAPLSALLGFEVEEITDRIKRLAIANAIIGLFGLLTLAFLLVAGFLALAARLGAINASLIFAGVFFVLAVAVYIGLTIAENGHKKQALQKRRSNETNAFVTTAALTALPVLLKSPLIRNVGLPVAALAATVLLFSKPKGNRADG